MPTHECAYINFSFIKALKWWAVSFNDPVLCYPHCIPQIINELIMICLKREDGQ